MTIPYGWAKRPMLERIDQVQADVPISFIYGSRSSIDSDSGYAFKKTRPDVQIMVGSFWVFCNFSSKCGFKKKNIHVRVYLWTITALSLNSWLFLFNCVFVFVKVIRGAGHYVFADQPDDFNQTVLHILAGTEKKSRGEGTKQWELPHSDDSQEGTWFNEPKLITQPQLFNCKPLYHALYS